jgi:amino acid adenylation domain-containing protein
LTLASNVERERLLATPAARTFPPRGSALDTLHGRFEEQARRRPDAVAVSGASGQLTYAELNSRANALAARLRAAGAERGSLVALFVERDVEMVVAVLAILKTGSAYLPIDPMYPRERAAFMLDDASARILVTRRGMDDSFAPTDVARVFVDAHDEDSLNAPIDAGAAAGDLAYVIYTSGSTGKPKGVMVTHHNVTRLFDATAHWYEFSENDVWSLFHSIAFDWSVWELWGALLHGGRVVVVPHATTRSPEDMLDLLWRERVTMLGQTPSAFRQLVAADAARAAIEPLSLRFVIFGGEALDVNMLRPWITRRGDQYPRLVNMFGITETTVHVTFRPITERDLDRRVRSPIGEPIPDLRLLVLDSAGQPVPVGVPGELVVGGDGVARGYLNRPELTASRFIPDPASSDPAARLYRSGDLARRLPDGDIEYLGRIDQQVKIRGFRIELGEIESTLARHPAVEQCAVIVRNDAADDPRIVAYVVPRAGAAASAAEMLGFVRASLPDYMVPSTIVTLASLPLTANHKLDVAALPRPERTESASLRPYVAPATEIETAIAAAWSRLLGVERVGVDDDFFELGGHSIMATALTGWLREHFRVAFPVYAIFESPTVRGMADRVQALAADAAEPRIESPREEFEL